MKNIYLSVLLSFGVLFSFGQTVIVSEYVDACSGTTPKAIELWNPSGVDIDMSVTNIIVEVQTNANTAWNNITTISTGILAAGEVIVVSATTGVGINASTCATKINQTLSHNGDDAYRITLGATVTDIFGDPSGTDPGSGWSGGGVVTNGGTIEILGGITTGNPAGWTDPSTRFQTVSSCATTTTTGFGYPPGGCPATLTPTIIANPTSVSALDYVLGAGPSGIDSIELSGSNLTGPVSGTAITDFEFSLDKILWNAFPGVIAGPVINVTPVKVYVRLKSALSVGTYSETITLSSLGATDVNVTFSGEVTPAPCVAVLQTLPYTGISGNAFFDHDSSNPPAPGPAEVCGGNFLLSYVTTPSTDGSDNEFGTQSNLGLNGLSSEDFGGEASFETFPVDVSAVSAVDINAFGNTSGSGVFTGGGEYLEWWYTLDGGAQIPFFTTSSDGSLADTETNIDVTGVLQIVVGFTFNMNGGGDGFEDMDVTITEYNPNVPTITVDTTEMEGFTYVEGSGPSATQLNTLEWTNLTSDVTSGNVVNHFEFSGDAGATWNDATILNVAIPPFPVNSPSPVNVLVRLKELLLTGTYYDTVVLASTGADTVRVYLEGEVTPAPAADCSQMFISEYGEPSGGSNKYIEIYNPTSAAVNLADYEIWKISNGGSWPESTVPLSGTLNSGDVYVISGTSFDANVDLVNGGVINFNGDDAMGLAYNDGSGFVLIDAVGEDGGDPGSGWDVAGTNNGTVDNILVRKASVKIPNTDWTSSAGTNTTDSEWEVISYTGGMALTTIGNHTSSCISNLNTWTGLTDTDWFLATNWSKNAVPTATDSVVIPTTPTGANFPIADADVSVLSLVVEAGASLDIDPSYGLIILGSATNNGTITLNSDVNGTAWLDEFTNGATYTGDIVVETFVGTGATLGQRYFGSPVASGSVQGLDGTYTGYPLGQLIPTATCDPTTLEVGSPYSNLFQWNEDATFSLACVQEGWEAINASSNLTPGKGYSGWMNDGSVISVTGTPNTADVVLGTSGVTIASGNAGYVNDAHGWHLLSNPFAAPLNIASVINSGFENPQTYDGGSGAFSGTFNPVLVSGDYVAIMQGFVAESVTGATFTASESDRLSGNTVWQKPDFTHMLEISVLGNGMGDRTYLYYDFDATNQFDPMGDCKKRTSDFGHPTLFTDLNGEKMSLNGLALNSMNTAVGLGLMAGSNGAFTLDFDGMQSFPSTSLIFLEDKLTGTFVNLREDNSYTFQASTNDIEDRFEIHFTAPITVETTDATCAGEDATIIVDFGLNNINNSAINWDFSLTNNSLPIASATNNSGEIEIVSLIEGNYELNVNFGTYTTTIPVAVAGVEVVDADFNVVSQVEIGTVLTIANASSGANTYEWSVEGMVSQNLDLTHTFNNLGLVDITLIADNEDCGATEIKTVEVVGKATGIRNSGLLESAKVYASNNTIVVDLSALSLKANTQVEVFNLLGQLIKSEEMANTKIQFNMNQAKSYFLVKLTNDNKQKVFKVLLK